MILKMLTLEFLSAPPSSVESEIPFSMGKKYEAVLNKQSPEIRELPMFCAYNLRISGHLIWFILHIKFLLFTESQSGKVY